MASANFAEAASAELKYTNDASIATCNTVIYINLELSACIAKPFHRSCLLRQLL